MPLWKLQPVARPQDSRWLNYDIWKEVIVRADSAALARQLAARLEWDPAEPPSGNESLTFRSAFQDEKLYWAVRLAADDAAALGGESGEQGVIRAVPFPEAERERSTERRSKAKF